jgi:OmpA-OmpF porin, OOP family
MNKTLSLLALACCVPLAQAADSSWYVGTGLGSSRADINTQLDGNNPFSALRTDDNDIGWKIFGGYRLNSLLSAELSYIDLGSHTGYSTVGDIFRIDMEQESQLFALDGLAHYAVLPSLSLFARAGAYRWANDVHVRVNALGTPSSISESDNGIRFNFGVGGEFNLSALGLRLEWTRFNNAGGTDFDFFNVSALYRF